MKKIRLLLGIIFVLALSLVCLASCGSKLEAPTGLRLDTDTLILSWDKNADASGYAVMIGEVEKMTRATSYSLENLDPGEYNVKVKALGNGKDLKDSPYVTFSFVKAPESGLIYKLISDNTEYQLIGVGGAAGDVVMESEFRGKPVTSIAESALANNSKITSFTVSENIKEIPKKAFYNCSAMTSITLPQGLTSIGDKAFQSCKALTSIHIPNGVTEIMPYTFAYCDKLSAVTGGDSLKMIGDFAFFRCSSLTSYVMPTGVETLGTYAFSGCAAMSSFTMSPAIKTIGENAFNGCELIAAVDLGNKLESIGKNAFQNCKAITAISLPDSLSSIGQSAFLDCTALATVTGGDNLTSVGYRIFEHTPFYENYEGDIVYLGNWILGCKNQKISENRDLTPLLREGITGIADYAFAGCQGFTAVTLPDVVTIGECAFYACTNLMDFRVGEDLTYIGKNAFVHCSILRNVYVKDSQLKTIEDGAFYNCARLSTMDLPETVETIGSLAFTKTGFKASLDGVIYVDDWAVGTKSLYVQNVTIKDGTTGIADYAFFNCQYIMSVEFPSSLEKIGRGSFLMALNIFIDQFPENLRLIDDYAFYGCENAYFGINGTLDLVLPDSLEKIGRSAFYMAGKLYGLEIPGSCKYIGDYAFYGCQYLGADQVVTQENPETNLPEETILKHPFIMHEGIEYIGSRAFYGCVGMIEAKIPDSVKEMGIRTFYNCTGLKKVEVGSGVTEIPDYAFYCCEALEEVTLSDNCAKIGKSAFYNCAALSTLKTGYKLSELGDCAFKGCASLPAVTTTEQMTKLGAHSLRGLNAATYFLVREGVTDISQHAFYNCLNATIYCEGDAPLSGWNDRWNSSFRPVIWGCTLSSDGSYVVSFVKSADTVDNFDAINGIQAPVRAGYTFTGWSTTDGGAVAYDAASIMDAPDGSTLYAVWQSE